MSTESRDPRGLLGQLFGKGTVVALLLAVFLISGTAWAAHLQPDDYIIFGYGSKSCGSWTAAKKALGSNQVVFHAWVGGYLTAYNYWVEKGDPVAPVGHSDSAGAYAWIDNYCQETPLDRVAIAAAALIDAIKAK